MSDAIKRFQPLLLLVALQVQPVLAQELRQPHVAEVYGQLMTYEEVDGRFRRSEPLPAGIDVRQARVTRVSPKGYVLVETANGPVWLDKLKVKVAGDLKLSGNVRCTSMVSEASDAVTAGVRGVGEGCR
ncbi:MULTISPECIES: hypothetical protein [Xanthomonas]|uniref:Uncharacterized protein n=1 Tax=Xanthomonas cucurbitae TaxID=56453 RepID=A0A2S7DKF9_9XANT|nr:hypothetical protein [Xanthomonas cucurbitae]PPU74280.1 hypothetical protein XcuCFBP2542_15560 [Xanthomonas cucurbitae]QHG86390.1 hypothetical protein EBN15_04680 [Xanthomonas cucurbitae]WDM68643.1 hypothetical protein K6981_04950 [Xanthomonas cucurbitae]WDM72517.1 hypothetical protein K6978_04945 [Xanthomonas cucurbitae]WDM76307.1 hypothetical protein K6982_04655 [Xanthomonas cucurbitae]